MADHTEENISACQDFDSTKNAIFKNLEGLKKWREENLQQFRKMQLLESEKYLRLSGESQKHFENFLKNEIVKSPEPARIKQIPLSENNSCSTALEKNDLGSSDTLQESSITGHLQRCFNNMPQSSPSVSENKINIDAQKSPISTEVHHKILSERNCFANKVPEVKGGSGDSSSIKPKRQFLKKGEGLLRYMPKSATNRHQVRSKVTLKSNNSQKRSPCFPQKPHFLKPAIHSTAIPSDRSKQLRFNIPGDLGGGDGEPQIEINPLKLIPSAAENRYSHQANSSLLTSGTSPEYYVPKDDKLDLPISGKLLTNKEKKTVVAPNANIYRISGKENETPYENSNYSPEIGLGKCLKDIHSISSSKKKSIEKEISDLNPRILSLQKEISSSRQETCLGDGDMDERGIPPVEDVCLENENLPSMPEKACKVSLHPTAPVSENNFNSNYRDCYENGVLKDSHPNQNSLEMENLASEISDLPQQNSQESSEISRLRERRLELEKEIKIYQQYNAKSLLICKERDEILRKLEKEREAFNKYKQAEKKKFETQMEEDRRQLRREKETFTRLQKLSKDTPTKKERDEIISLRQQGEKLQEDVKRLKIKHASDMRRLKTQLDAVEKERDTFKLENMKLNEQVQDLLAALKTRMKKHPEVNSKVADETGENNARSEKDEITEESLSSKCSGNEDIQEDQVYADLSKKSDQISPRCGAEKKSKANVFFNLTNTRMIHQNHLLNSTRVLSENESESSSNEKDYYPGIYETAGYDENVPVPKETETSDIQLSTISTNNEFEDINHGNKATVIKETETPTVNLSTISLSTESECKEIDYGDRTERIYPNSEREIRFLNGLRKIISADGKTTKFFFYNGDIKEIYSDKREVFKYVDGRIQTKFPDGLEVTEFPNGKVKRQYPDGQKEVQFSDGTMRRTFADGSEKVHSADGNVYHLSADGTVTVEFANGQREIRTASYKRREFPDGSLKILYNNGRIETRFSNGRIKMKDKDGKIIFDTKYLPISKG